MKKTISLFLLLCGLSNSAFTQTKTIDYQEIVTGKGVYFGAVMDNGTQSITMTISGPNDRWFGVGFGTGMSNGDMLIYTDGKSGAMHVLEPTDYKMTAQNAGGVNKDATQDWTILSNTETAGLRTIVASRDLNTGDTQDNVLNFTDLTVNVVWAKHSSASHTLAYHGNQNRGVKQFTWVEEGASLIETVDNGIEIISLPEGIKVMHENGEKFEISVFSMSGQVIMKKGELQSEYTILSDAIGKGQFVIVVESQFGVESKVIRL